MRNAQALMLGFVVAGAFASGCRGSTTDAAMGSSEARLVVSAQEEAMLHVVAVDDATASPVADQTVEVKGGQAAVIPIIMTPSRYTLTVDVSGAGLQSGRATAHVNLKDGDTAQVSLVVLADNPTPVQVGVDMAPRIDAIDAQMKGGMGHDQRVVLHVDAFDADSDKLSYFWSGEGIKDVEAGSSTISIPAKVTADRAALVHVVVQDPEGATATATIALEMSETTVHGTIVPGSSNTSHPASACQEAHAQCKASCAPSLGVGAGNVVADGACMSACGMALAACEAN